MRLLGTQRPRRRKELKFYGLSDGPHEKLVTPGRVVHFGADPYSPAESEYTLIKLQNISRPRHRRGYSIFRPINTDITVECSLPAVFYESVW